MTALKSQGRLHVRIFTPSHVKTPAPTPLHSVESAGAAPRVLIVSGTLTGGGAERFASTLMHHISQDFDVSLGLLRDEIGYPIPENVDVSILGHRGPWTARRTVRRLEYLIDRLNPDVVISTMDYLAMFVGQALMRSRTQPFWIYRTSNSPEYQFRTFRGYMRMQWLKHVHPRADLFIANSEGLAESFQETFPCARGRTEVVLNPIDVARLEQFARAEWPEPIDASVANICYSARLQKHKRPDLMIRAFRQILDQTPAKLWMCGDGPMRGKVENMVEDFGLRSHVRMVGFRENIFPLLKASTVAVATSDYEGMPNNLLEAQVLGVPVVSTRSTFGPEEIIDDGRTGHLINRGDADAVASAVIRLVSQPDLRQRLADEARRETIRRFGVAGTMPVWQTLLRKAAGVGSAEKLSRRAA